MFTVYIYSEGGVQQGKGIAPTLDQAEHEALIAAGLEAGERLPADWGIEAEEGSQS